MELVENILCLIQINTKTILATYAEQAYGISSTTVEPALGPLDPQDKYMINGNTSDNARADLCILHFNSQHSYTFLDICVVSAVCQSNVNISVSMSISNT